MKQILTFFVCLLIAGMTCAQEHLSFKGVPIDGTSREFTNAMVNAGFEFVGETSKGPYLIGKFAGYEDCEVVGFIAKKNNVIYEVGVKFPDRETWIACQQDYEALKTMLTKKYGSPSKSEEKFNGDVGNYNNYFVMEAIKEEEYKWYTTFSTELGDITISIIEGDENHTGAVLIVYTDKANSKKPSAIDDL